MLDYTKAAFKKTVEDLKKADYIRNIATQIVFAAYLVYSLIAKNGVLWVNVALLILSVVYFFFFLRITDLGKTPERKPFAKLGKRGTAFFSWCKRLARIYSLFLTLLGIYRATESPSPFSIIFTALLIVGLVLEVVFEIVVKVIVNRVNLIIEGLEADIDEITKPVRSIGNFFKKMSGQEVEIKEKTENQLFLAELAEKNKAEKKLIKAQKKEAYKQQKKDEKEFKRNEKLLKKAQKKDEKATKKAENALLDAYKTPKNDA